MLATIIISIVLLVIVYLIIRSMIRNVKNGKSIEGCGGDCSKCGGCSHH